MMNTKVLHRNDKRNLRAVALVTAVGFPVAGCFGDLDQSPSLHDGVYGGCQNLNGGLDESGNPPTGDNWWWVQYEGVPEDTPIQECGPLVTDSLCCFNASSSAPGPCFEKEYQLPGSELYDGGMGPLCVTAEFAGTFDPLDDWATGDYPSAVEEEMRNRCSAMCENKLNLATAPVSCAPENWAGVKTNNGWIPAHGFNCAGDAHLNQDDPDGSEIPWTLVGGQSPSPSLDCDLDGDCVHWFYPQVAAFVLTPGHADIIDFETRSAHYLGVEGSGSSLALDMSGSGSGVDDTEDLYGLAEYTPMDCGDDVCPFYLANLSAYNTVDSWDIRVDTSIGRLNKHISDVQIDLIQSTLGVQDMTLSTVAFAPGAIRLRVEFTVSSCPSCDTTGDGTHVTIVENDDYVFAEYDAGALTIEHTFSVQGSGSATLSVTVVPDEEPPEAGHDLSATENSNVPGGLVLDASRSTSTDPDNDITEELWWIDGYPCTHGCFVPVGAHEISLEASDSRGATHRTPEVWVSVQ